MAKIFIYIVIMTSLIGCKKKHPIIENLLIDKNAVWSYNSVNHYKYTPIGHYFRFYSVDEYEYFHSAFDSDSICKIKKINICGSSNTNNSIKTWNYNEKSNVLIFDNHQWFSFLVQKFNKDTIWLKGNGYDGSFALVRTKLKPPK